jgi:serine protease AprX
MLADQSGRWRSGGASRGAALQMDGAKGVRRLLRVLVVFCLWLLIAAVAAGASWSATTPTGASWDGVGVAGHRFASVIVRARPGAAASVEAAVGRLGGRVELRLPIVNGFSAQVPQAALGRLQLMPGVLSVSADARVHALSDSYSPAGDGGSMYNVTLGSGAQEFWKAGYTGQGVDVAVIDSGVAPVDGLTGAGKVVNGPDLSFESQAPNLQYLDSFGHGTHMAGIIAGRASGAVAGQYAGDQTNFLGMAPDARIVSVKVADAHGATDVSQVIAAITWVVQHRTDNGLNIRVLNLSYGTDSTQEYSVDPLAYAAEQAWKQGIFVVASTGNAGFVMKTGSMMDPGYDPLLMAVGAADSNGTVSLSDDSVPSFSSSGGTKRRPDLVAPGTHIVGLRDPGSLIDQTYSSSGAVTGGLFRGSGTSQAAAVVSGAAALVIQQRPTITPGQLKKLLTGTAMPLRGALKEAQGSGELNLAKALTLKTPSEPGAPAPSTGAGLLELSRGSTHPVQNGITLAGEQDIFGAPFLSPTMPLLEATGSSWSGGAWNGSSWSGSSWSGSSWSGSSWSGSSWSGSSWSGSSWSGSSWSGSSWSGSSWSGSSWSDNNWLGGNWADSAWADSSWG